MLSFESTHAAMAWERAMEGLVPLRTMPTLRQVSASCGISLRVEGANLPRLHAFLRSEHRPTAEAQFYLVEGDVPLPLSLS